MLLQHPLVFLRFTLLYFNREGLWEEIQSQICSLANRLAVHISGCKDKPIIPMKVIRASDLFLPRPIPNNSRYSRKTRRMISAAEWTQFATDLATFNSEVGQQTVTWKHVTKKSTPLQRG